MTGKNILVIGSGVSGLTSALLLMRAGHKVTIWSKESAGEFPSTSYNAYAMWVPVKIDSDPRVERWTNESYSEFEKLSRDAATGVEMRKIIALKPEHSEPWYATSLSIFRHATNEELPVGYADGHVLESAPVIDPTVYLPWLHNEVQASGGKFEQREVEDIAKCPAEFEAIINCSGLGARKLAADAGLFPERVQVVRIKTNGFTDVVIDDEGHNKRSCVVPHRDYIQIGAVFDGSERNAGNRRQAYPGHPGALPQYVARLQVRRFRRDFGSSRFASGAFTHTRRAGKARRRSCSRAQLRTRRHGIPDFLRNRC